jgi:hypothetical protein
MNDSVRSQGDASPSEHPASPHPSTGRRALLVAMPTILSLHQGAARAAVTSAVLVASSNSLYCLKDAQPHPTSSKGYSVPDSIEVTQFSPSSERKYCKDGKQVSPIEMCRNGDEYQYTTNLNADCNSAKDEIYVNKGALISASSVTSFQSRITFFNV